MQILYKQWSRIIYMLGDIKVVSMEMVVMKRSIIEKVKTKICLRISVKLEKGKMR